MTLKNDFPELYHFFVGYFPDADFDGLTDEEVVNNFIEDHQDRKKALEKVKSDIVTLIEKLEDYWEDVGAESNRYFETKFEALEWLIMIKKKLYK